MDAGVYDHIQEEVLKREQDDASGGKIVSGTSDSTAANPAKANEPGDLTTDLQETYRSFTASPWGMKIGGLWGSVNKQAQSYIQEAQREASAAGQSAFKGFNDLKTSLEGRARSMSAGTVTGPEAQEGAATEGAEAGEKKQQEQGEEKATKGTAEGGEEKAKSGATASDEPTSPAFIERFRSEASRRLADLQRAEDAADEALLKFGTNLTNFFRDAVIVTPPIGGGGTAGGADGAKADVLFESKDADGKRVVHATRFDAQLHVIHCSLDSFTKDPASPEWERWSKEFDIDKRTDEIAGDLKRYDELRRAMEKLVPEKVDYASFWSRYYFLRLVIESEEKRRREMLKAASKTTTTDADLAWDEDSDNENSSPSTGAGAGAGAGAAGSGGSDKNAGPSTPQPRSSTEQETHPGSATAGQTASTPLASSAVHLKEPRKSHDEKSTAGSESSYDLVSGATSAAPGSPQEKKVGAAAGGKGKKEMKVKEESDEEDWE